MRRPNLLLLFSWPFFPGDWWLSEDSTLCFSLDIAVVIKTLWQHSLVAQLFKKSTCGAGDPSSIPGSGRSPGEGIGYPPSTLRLPRWLRWQRCHQQGSRPGVVPGLKVPWRRGWQPTLVSLPGESPWQRSLVGYSPWGRKCRTRLGNEAHSAHNRNPLT